MRFSSIFSTCTHIFSGLLILTRSDPPLHVVGPKAWTCGAESANGYIWKGVRFIVSEVPAKSSQILVN